jgi:sulfite exporter TauE/SafE
MEIFSAFIIGLMGSFHCIGMCGPLVLALPVNSNKGFKYYAGRVLYNTGRVITYSVIGLVFGIAGKGIALAGFQQAVSILLGSLIIFSFLLPRSFKAKITGSPVISRITSPLRSYIGKLFKQKTLPSFLFIGMLNGLLPCGFVYMGVAGAVALGNVLSGTLFMIFFGLGTVPAMLAASLFGGFVNINVRRKLRRTVPVFAVIMALIFILRGLNLGIPYLSPKLSAMKTAPAMHMQEEEDCCH